MFTTTSCPSQFSNNYHYDTNSYPFPIHNAEENTNFAQNGMPLSQSSSTRVYQPILTSFAPIAPLVGNPFEETSLQNTIEITNQCFLNVNTLYPHPYANTNHNIHSFPSYVTPFNPSHPLQSQQISPICNQYFQLNKTTKLKKQSVGSQNRSPDHLSEAEKVYIGKLLMKELRDEFHKEKLEELNRKRCTQKVSSNKKWHSEPPSHPTSKKPSAHPRTFESCQ